MRCAFSSLLPIALVLAGTAAAQPVDPGKEGELAKLVKPVPGARACFRRDYDARHLSQHPLQKVTHMEFRLTYFQHEPDAYYEQGQRNYYFELLARLRDQKTARPLSAMGECAPGRNDKAIFCGVECDGGGVVIRLRDRPDQLLVDLSASGRIRMTSDCGEDEENAVELEPGEDDRTFLLTKTAEADCPAYDDW